LVVGSVYFVAWKLRGFFLTLFNVVFLKLGSSEARGSRKRW